VEPDELGAWLRLTLTPGVGNDAARRLLAGFGLPEAIFRQPRSALGQVVSDAQVQALLMPPAQLDLQLQATLRWLADAGPGGPRQVVVLGDPLYPVALLRTEDPPLLLYMMGHGSLQAPTAESGTTGGSPALLPALQHGIAIVGSRNPTPQGEANARQFAMALADAGLTVVSGMALGVDGAAHGGALEANGAGRAALATVAVVGTGLDRVYPRQHLALARKICGRGLIVSEYPLGTPPLAANFPRRNRLIAGLSAGTLVVEAALRSGSLITAAQAIEQGKEVFAIPGSIHSVQSRGCHSLIKQGAKLVEAAQDVLEELRLAPASAKGPGRTRPASQSAADSASVEHPWLRHMGYDPVTLDMLIARSGIGAADWQAQLLEFELEGQVARLPGGAYQRVGRG
jgi:DNA processing protein